MVERLTPKRIKAVLAAHLLWCRGEAGGEMADLRGANLEEANLQGANLRWADLQEARMQKADLQEADLQGARLWGAGLPFRIIQIGPIGSRADYLTYRFDTDQVMTGCFTGTLDEFTTAVEDTHGDSPCGLDYRAAIVMLRDVRDRCGVR